MSRFVALGLLFLGSALPGFPQQLPPEPHPTSVASAANLPDAPSAILVVRLAETGALPAASDTNVPAAAVASPNQRPHFHWGPALGEMFIMLSIQHAGNYAMDKWIKYDISHGNFFRDWFSSVGNWRWTVWNDNDPFLDDYIAHPMQGSVYALIYIQNDDRGRNLALSNSRAYWMSRLRAFAWSSFWSAQWKLGPMSETSIQNLGLYPYYSNESHGMTNGTGMVDLVMTPVGGIVWLIGEEALDKAFVSRLRNAHRNRLWKLGISVLTPTHSAANILRLKAPWYRDPVIPPIVAER